MNTENEGLMETPVSSEEIYKGKIVHLFRDTVRLPDGKIAVREVMRHPGAVAVVPVDEAGGVILVRQYRYPFSEALLEIPAGKLDAGEKPERCARRELEEETGLTAERSTPLGLYYPSVAVLDERIHLFLARGLTQKNSHPDEDEFLRVERLPLETLVQFILDGSVPDGKTQAAVLKVWHLMKQDVNSDKKL
jgi:ADP-ribose pyrophosphatase